MKKYLSLVLSVVLLLTLALNVTAASADGDPAIVCENVYCKAGEQVTVDVMIANNPGFMCLVVTPVCAPELTLVGVANGNLLPEPDIAGNYVWLADDDVTDDGLLATLTFQVAETVADGTYAVGFVVQECFDADENEVTLSVESGSVTVGEVPSTPIDQFEYELDGDELIILAYIGEDSRVVIGDTYEIDGTEYTVTMIAEEAFSGNDIVSSVEIPGTVKTIDAKAFEQCESLTTVKLNEGLETIGDKAFIQSALTQIVLPRTVTSVGEEAFYRCDNMTGAVVLCKDVDFGDHALGYYRISATQKYVLIDGFVLKGHSGSTAETYAEGMGITFKEVLSMASASVTLQHNLAVNFKVERALFEDYGYTDPYVTVVFNGNTVKLTDYTVSGEHYVFSFRDIAPNQMMDTMTATLYVTEDGVECATAAKEYSVAQYCYGVLAQNADNTELRTLLVDMLHYGAASQTYTGYKTDELANAALTEEQLAWGTNTEPAMETVLNPTYKTVANPAAVWKGAGLNLTDAVTMRLMFTAESVAGLSVKFESGEEQWTIPADQLHSANGMYYVYFNGLNAGQMRDEVYVTVYNGETPVSNTACYSIGSYAYEMKDSTIAGLSDLVKAMMKYGDSAYAYAN